MDKHNGQDATYTITFDGGCNGNPGAMYGSYQIATRDGRNRIERCKFGPGTNNRAEYLALVTALGDVISRCDAASVPVERFTVKLYGDSQIIIRQVNGEYGVNDPELKKLWRQAMGHLERFESFSIEWKPREEIVKALGH